LKYPSVHGRRLQHPNNSTGDAPAFGHIHIFITGEMADLRKHILRQAILDEGLSASIAEHKKRPDLKYAKL
jgi:hypothetical protein